MPSSSVDGVLGARVRVTETVNASSAPVQATPSEPPNEYDAWSDELRRRISSHQSPSPLAVGIAPSAPRVAGAAQQDVEVADALERVQFVIGYMLNNSARIEGILPNLTAEEVGLVLRAAQIEHEALGSVVAQRRFVHLLRDDATTRRIELMTERIPADRPEHAAAQAYRTWLTGLHRP